MPIITFSAMSKKTQGTKIHTFDKIYLNFFLFKTDELREHSQQTVGKVLLNSGANLGLSQGGRIFKKFS